MIRILTLALCLVIPAAAAAQSSGDAPLAPSLKQNVIVTDELVRIGDLIDNAGAAAQIAVFRAPDLGSTGTVAVQRIVEAVRAHDVFAINTHGLKDISVTRASRNIANTDIEERIASAIASQYRIGEAKNIGITFDRNVATIHVEPGIVGDLADHPPLLRSAQRTLRRHARCAGQPCRAPRRLAFHRHRRGSLRDGRADARGRARRSAAGERRRDRTPSEARIGRRRRRRTSAPRSAWRCASRSAPDRSCAAPT